MRRYAGKTFVVKYGGHAMGDRRRRLVRPRRRAAASRSASTRSSCMAAGRRSTTCSSGSASRADLSTGCGSPTRDDDGSRRDGARRHHQQAARRRDQCRRRLRDRAHRQGWRPDPATKRPHRSSRRQTESISALSASRSGSPPMCSPTFQRSDIIPVIAPIGVGARRRDLQHQRRHGRRRRRRRGQGDAVSAADRCRRACSTPTRS